MQRLAVAALLVSVATGSTVFALRPVPFHADIETSIAPQGPCGPTCGILNILGNGEATHMGRVSITGPVDTDFAAGTQSGTSTLTAADGSELEIDIIGTFIFTSQTDVAFTGTWTVASGSGRFEGSNGSGQYSGTASLQSNTGDLHLNGTVTDTGRN